MGEKFCVFPPFAQVGRNQGSETFVHLNHHGEAWVGLLHGIHDLELGAPLKVYLDPSYVYIFSENGDLVAPASYALAA